MQIFEADIAAAAHSLSATIVFTRRPSAGLPASHVMGIWEHYCHNRILFSGNVMCILSVYYVSYMYIKRINFRAATLGVCRLTVFRIPDRVQLGSVL